MTILQPVVALAAWTMVMWLWMYATRLPAMATAKVDPDSLANTPGASLDQMLPVQVQWKAKNYNHLHEAPTVFYAVCLVLAVVEAGNGLATTLAWVYVALRVVHSLVQAIINKVPLRFLIFAASSLVLIALIVLAAMAVF
ncbi:MAPEG family protein [Aurantiacibacter sp. MUD11]|uniref:MAPEG family protein n=1 Tax=Aurantiacibacter sp. MUD11 TaxID=3003265 RepID=UPI0022AA3AE5|nr:MAPEG family protein [Aurantiacibacter sp. MUD11]WAT18598.1 MAPEG family protein [Aurantiacibacter sp. MUD11]